MLSSLCYTKKATIFMKKTSLLGKYKALNMKTDDIIVVDVFWGGNKI